MAMFPGLTHEPVNQNSVHMEITEFVEDLVTKAEEIHEENEQLKKQIEIMKKKLEIEKEIEAINRKHKIELLTLFRQLMERRANMNKGHCKNCPSLESDLKEIKEKISNLLKEQIIATEKVFAIKQDIKEEKVREEKKLHEMEEFKQRIKKRKADTSKHFRQTKFRADWLRLQIKEDLRSKASCDLILAIQKEVTAIAINKAFDDIPNKIDAFEDDAIIEAQNEANKEIAIKDRGRRVRNDFYEILKDQRREQYMKWI